VFQVDLEIYRGPLDLLLYLVRKHEVEVTELSIGLLAEQYVEYLDLLEELNVDEVGEFIDIASTLVEMKSRQVLPRVEEEVEAIDDPREGLVQRLLEYKRYKDAAGILEEKNAEWQHRFPRVANDLPARKIDPAEQPIHEVELWDLVSAFGRVMRDHHTNQPTNILYDDTPIQVYMQRIHLALVENRRTGFSSMFQLNMHKSAMIGIFLAVLELVRHHGVRTEQEEQGEIWIIAGDNFNPNADFSDADDYGSAPSEEE